MPRYRPVDTEQSFPALEERVLGYWREHDVFHETLRRRAKNIAITHASFTEHLASLPESSADAYVLLDAQDWMTDAQLTALWTEIGRTARPGASNVAKNPSPAVSTSTPR